MEMIVVSDTSPVSNLAAIGKLDLLHQLYDNVVIPWDVYQEIVNAGATEPATLALKHLDWIQRRSVDNLELQRDLQANLDPGEAAAIALAVELKADRLIMDERRGREQAIKAGLKVIGLLGILLAAKKQGLIPAVQPLLDDLIAHGFWVRPQLYQELLSLAGE